MLYVRPAEIEEPDYLLMPISKRGAVKLPTKAHRLSQFSLELYLHENFSAKDISIYFQELMEAAYVTALSEGGKTDE